MKSYLDQQVEYHQDLQHYKIDMSEIAMCTKALDGLPDIYTQIKAAARASPVTTIPELINLLLAAERTENQDIITEHHEQITSLNTERKFTRNDQRTHKTRFCKPCTRNNHNTHQCWASPRTFFQVVLDQFPETKEL